MAIGTEQRVIATKPKIGARPTSVGAASDPPAGGAGAKPKGKKKKLLVIVAAAVLVLGGGGGYWFLMGPGAAAPEAEAAPVEEPAPVPGEVVTVPAISLNLASGHYLRLGLALQLTAEAAEAPDPAAALNLAIDLFSGRTVEEVSTTEGREALRLELELQVTEAYEGEVMAVYLTDYVTQ